MMHAKLWDKTLWVPYKSSGKVLYWFILFWEWIIFPFSKMPVYEIIDVSIVNFEHVIAGWEQFKFLHRNCGGSNTRVFHQ